jgi:hypothetical protein
MVEPAGTFCGIPIVMVDSIDKDTIALIKTDPPDRHYFGNYPPPVVIVARRCPE